MDEKGRIEELNDKLYSRTRYRDPLDERSSVEKSEPAETRENWQTPALDEMLKYERITPKTNPFVKKIFVSALLFFVATVLVAGFVFTGGAIFISSRNVDINILGPSTIGAGEVLGLGINIVNTNNADLEFAHFSIQYPQGSRHPDNTAEALTYMKSDLGVVKAGTDVVQNVRMVLLGSTGEVKQVKFSVEYKVKGSNATFYKDKIFEIVIGNAPITLVVNSPLSVVSGENFISTVSISLNSTEILKNVILKAEYPYGYNVSDTNPKPVTDDNVWLLGDLSPGDKKTVSIHGKLLGENGEERTFRFYVGVSDSDNINPNLKINMVSELSTIAIERPSIGLDITLNGERGETYIGSVARPIVTSIKFQNNLANRLINPRLEVVLSGGALDKSSIIFGNSGFYDPMNSKVIWSLTNTLGVPEVAPGQGGQVTLSFASLPNPSLIGGTRDIMLDFSIIGTPVDAVGQKPVVVNEIRKVKISSQVSFSQKVLRSLGPFANYGPMPPKVGEETTYTIVFGVSNIQNDIIDASVTARLGSGVGWLAAQSLIADNLSYDTALKSITWDIGTLSSGSSPAIMESIFQVVLIPSISQVGKMPSLIDNIVFSGRDALTGEKIILTSAPLTTRLPSDPAFIQGDDIVVK